MNKAFLEQKLEDARKLAKHWEEQAAYWKAQAIELEQRVVELEDMVKLP